MENGLPFGAMASTSMLVPASVYTPTGQRPHFTGVDDRGKGRGSRTCRDCLARAARFPGDQEDLFHRVTVSKQL